ncbi:MAG: molybdopterin-dependent oxidoreductase [Pseudomonadota bacterium]
MKFTSSHWGTYQLDGPDGIKPIDDDPRPSRIGKGWVSAATDRSSRILTPVARRGWLEGDNGRNRNDDSFVELTWEAASALVAQSLDSVRRKHGNSSIFGGSYGWASTGRFHHAQSQLRRFLNLTGGYVGSRETYSHAAAEVLFPHILGLSNRAFQDQMTSLSLVGEHCEFLLAFGGISERTAQISSSGVARHDIGLAVSRLHERGGDILNVSPCKSDLPSADWLSIRPGTDTALMLALAYDIVANGGADETFLERCTSGWPEWRAYILGQNDGIPKTPQWAAAICDVPVDRIKDIAGKLVSQRSMIAVNWGMQRAQHGEQTIWAALGLACVVGQIGRPGTGFAFGYGSTTHVGRSSRLINWPSLPQGQNQVTDYIPVARVADMLTSPGGPYQYDGQSRSYPDIRLVYWCGGNPFHHHQDLNRLAQAWTRPETVIVHDHTWTATARRADIVLPSTTPLERADLMMNRRDPSIFYMSPLHAPIGGAKDDFDIFRGIAEKMGLADAFTERRNAEQWLQKLWLNARRVAQDAGFDLPEYEAFKEDGRFDVPDASEERIAFAAFIADPNQAALATETGKITICNETIEGFAAQGCPGHPTWLQPQESLLNAEEGQLHLISNQPDTRLHGQNDRGAEALADKIDGREPAYLHPAAAEQRGLSSGDIIRVWNGRGACLAGVRLDADMREDCIILPTGAWFDPQTVDGKPLEVHGNPNVLTIDRGCSELSQGNMAHTCLVRVAKWSGPLPALTIDQPPNIANAAPFQAEEKP